MNKRIIKILISIWLIIALFLSAALIYGIVYARSNGGIFDIIAFNIGPLKIQKEETLSIENCNEIKLDFSSEDIIIYSTDDPKLKVVQKSSNKLKENEKFTVNTENNKISIGKAKASRNINILFFGYNRRLIELYIPKNYLKDLDINLSSGDIVFDSDINLNNFKCHQSSGDFNAKNLKVNSYNIRTSSGDIDINNLWGTGEVLVTSGDIKIAYKDISEYTKVTTTSGDIKLTIPLNLSFEFHGQCTSGDINSNFQLNYENKRGTKANAKVGNGPYKKIDVTTTSGDIKIQQ
ncbi:hypothetical protein CLHOM_29590 [Clostridium homopropionicum DSM 5847]|uniref:DUF4097 domain-containing protein n=1 Tax=Clostridium homopropionicum DSM 5847 TaxID=1121318 RepID=A0A0L6Z6U0_9CLOT|nr:DUF4097 family beta strand repeat-containing protein [Clostridium homopropionicum]KOA18675.1 hypothetical protein CLHOM_29590 [Clostridium homopropionicum DSM 5847]SFG52314.1 lia operon protein LiaG [Clostridium homopropionicum]